MHRRGLAVAALGCTAALSCGTTDAPTHTSTSALGSPTPGPQPVFRATSSAPSPPPPISGGTLTVAPDGRTAVAADPDRDAVYVVDLPTRAVRSTVPLPPRAEPGRIAIDAHGAAHVVLRAGGAIARIELSTGAAVVTPVCVAPRGIAYDRDADALLVACAEGALVSLPLPLGSRPSRTLPLGRDLRDVAITKDKILVSRFRSADVLVLSRTALTTAGSAATHGGNVGWRMIAAPPLAADPTPDPQEPAIISQDPVDPSGSNPNGYYGSGAADACAAPTITGARLDLPGQPPIRIPPAVLPVDLATNGHEYAVVAAGNGHTPSLPQLFVYRSRLPAPADYATAPLPLGVTNTECIAMAKALLPGQAIAAAFDGDDELIVQSREPAVLYVMSPDRQHVWREIPLSPDSREDIGHAIFHSNSGGFLACASCHAEGGEDGRTWTFVEGHRRTPSLRGTLAGTAPYHWDGELRDIGMLVDHIFVTRMSGPPLAAPAVSGLESWLFALPPPPKLPGAPDAVTRGATLFRERGCAGCHAGSRLTDNETHDVGTGGAFQVPSLVGVGWRPPFLHDGCAKTLADRFTLPCGGREHGDTAGLEQGQVADLTAFLESL